MIFTAFFNPVIPTEYQENIDKIKSFYPHFVVVRSVPKNYDIPFTDDYRYNADNYRIWQLSQVEKGLWIDIDTAVIKRFEIEENEIYFYKWNNQPDICVCGHNGRNDFFKAILNNRMNKICWAQQVIRMTCGWKYIPEGYFKHGKVRK